MAGRSTWPRCAARSCSWPSGRPDGPWTRSPHLKATYDAFGRDPRFVMIGLNQDFAEAMRWCVARHRPGLGATVSRQQRRPEPDRRRLRRAIPARGLPHRPRRPDHRQGPRGRPNQAGRRRVAIETACRMISFEGFSQAAARYEPEFGRDDVLPPPQESVRLSSALGGCSWTTK